MLAAARSLALGLLLASGAAAQPDAIPASFFGMSVVPVSDSPKVAAGTFAHPSLGWPNLEPARGVFDFTALDAYIDNAKSFGLVEPATNVVSVAVTLGPTPAWAVADRSSCSGTGVPACSAPPDDLNDWTEFVAALCSRYDGATRPHLRLVEPWGEANDGARWSGTTAHLVALARTAYDAIHGCDPATQVLTPSVSGPIPAAAEWMTAYLAAGGAAAADGGAYHGWIAPPVGTSPYPMPEDDAAWGGVVLRATRMRDAFDRGGLSGKPMFQTEGSWGLRNVTDPDAQIAWVSRYFLLQAGVRSSLNLQMAAWNAWGVPAVGWGTIEDASGKATVSGRAYDRVYHWLVGASMPAPCATAGTVVTCALTRPGGYVARAVWSTAGPVGYTPVAGFTQMRDLSGRTTPLSPGASIAIGAAPVLLEGSPRAPAGAPDIVLILTDDQDVKLGSMAVMPRVKELLADRGATFTNSFVPLSLCCPSRAATLRGQYPHDSGVLYNFLPNGGFWRAYVDGTESSTLATLLHGAGYRTALLGKYLNQFPLWAEPAYIPPGWDEWYSPASGNPYSEYNYTLNENGTLVTYADGPDAYMTDVLSKKATDFIRRSAATPGKPIFLMLATYAPHGPYTPAPRHRDLFPGAAAPRPPSFDQADVRTKPSYIRSLPPLDASNIADIDAHYRMRLQALQAVDEAVASIVSALAAAGRLEHTYLVFTSDNGYHMGEYRLLEGKYTPYATDIRVPLILKGPGIPSGVVRDELAASIDLAPTFAELAGVPGFSFFDGRSLKALASGSDAVGWRRSFLLEEFNTGVSRPVDPARLSPEGVKEGTDPRSKTGMHEPPDRDDLRGSPPDIVDIIPSYYGYQTGSYKYIEYQTGERELYVAADGDDVTNVAAAVDPAIGARLAAHLRKLVGCRADACRAAEAVEPPALLTAGFTISPGAPGSGTPVTLAAVAAGTPPFAFTWDVDGVPISGRSVQMTLPDGTHTATLTVRDGIGAEATAVRTFPVGLPPIVQIASPADGLAVEAGVPVAFAATGTPSVAGATLSFAWDFGDGTPAVPGASITRAFGAPGTYVVTVRGVDSRGATARDARTVRVGRPTLAGASLLLPVVVETPGARGSFYTSEVTIASRLAAPVEVLLAYTASVGGGSGYARLTLGPGEQRVVPALVAWLRARGLAIRDDRGAHVGTLVATFGGAASTSGLFLGARTFTADPAGGPGTFGLFCAAAVASEEPVTVVGLQQGNAQRSNLALVNASGSAITLLVSLFGPDGAPLGDPVERGLDPHGWTQIDAPLAALGAGAGVAVVSRLSGTGAFTAYGVLNDQTTSDGSFLPAFPPSASGPDRLLPIVLSTGAWSSELTLANRTATPLPLRLTYTASPQIGTGAGSGTGTMTLAPFEQRITDAFALLRQAGVAVPAGDTAGSLLLSAPSGGAAAFAAGVRTYTRAPGGGTYGVFSTALAPADSATGAAFLHGLRQDAALRSNVAVVNRGDAADAITVRVTYFGPDGAPAGSPDVKTLAPGEWVQWNAPLSSRGITSGRASVEKVSGASRFLAYAVLNDQTTSDGSIIPMTD